MKSIERISGENQQQKKSERKKVRWKMTRQKGQQERRQKIDI